MSSETWEIIRKLRGDEIELQIAFQCAPLITGLKESNLLNIEKQDYQRMKDIFKESELTIYPLGIHAGKITVFLYHPDRLEAFFSKESVQALLHEIGYTDTNLKQVLPVFRAHYQQYLREKKVFPHETVAWISARGCKRIHPQSGEKLFVFGVLESIRQTT